MAQFSLLTMTSMDKSALFHHNSKARLAVQYYQLRGCCLLSSVLIFYFCFSSVELKKLLSKCFGYFPHCMFCTDEKEQLNSYSLKICIGVICYNKCTLVDQKSIGQVLISRIVFKENKSLTGVNILAGAKQMLCIRENTSATVHFLTEHQTCRFYH